MAESPGIATTITPLVVAALAVVAAWLQHRPPHGGGRRGKIKANAELLALLPRESTAWKQLASRLDDDVTALLHDDTTKRRDPFGIVLASLFLAAGVAALVIGLRAGGFVQAGWLVAAVPLLLFGVVGMTQDARRRVRDDRGRPIPDQWGRTNGPKGDGGAEDGPRP